MIDRRFLFHSFFLRCCAFGSVVDSMNESCAMRECRPGSKVTCNPDLERCTLKSLLISFPSHNKHLARVTTSGLAFTFNRFPTDAALLTKQTAVRAADWRQLWIKIVLRKRSFGTNPISYTTSESNGNRLDSPTDGVHHQRLVQRLDKASTQRNVKNRKKRKKNIKKSWNIY